MKVNDSNVKIDTYKDFSTSKLAPKAISEEKPKKINAPVIATTAVGTMIPLLLIRRYQGLGLKVGALKGMDFKSKIKTVFKSFSIKYDLKEMLFMSYGSVFGGLAGGLLFDNKEKKKAKAKIKEAVFQLSNIAIPTCIVAGLLKLSENSKKLKGIFPKIASVVLGIGAGMPLASVVSSKINNSIIDKDNPSKRKIRLKDCFVHVDDLIGALVLSKIPFADKLHAEKVLPVLYGICGYEAGVER